jgi:hypothetical protein
MEPTTVRAGTTITWTRDSTDTPPSAGWSLDYALRNADAALDLTASGAGNTYTVSVDAATSGGWLAGTYAWIAIATKAGVKVEVATGALTVLPNLAAPGALETRSFARQLLDAVEATLLGRASKGQLDVVDMALEGRGLKRTPEVLVKLRSQLMVEVEQEDRINAGVTPWAGRLIPMGFTRA